MQHEKKLEQLVDAKLQKQYNRQEVEELIQVRNRNLTMQLKIAM